MMMFFLRDDDIYFVSFVLTKFNENDTKCIQRGNYVNSILSLVQTGKQITGMR